MLSIKPTPNMGVVLCADSSNRLPSILSDRIGPSSSTSAASSARRTGSPSKFQLDWSPSNFEQNAA